MSDTTRRPLPLLTLDNEFFWTSGADGTLRFQRCDSCDAFAHPPAPVCRYCHGDRLTVVPVSGKATLVGFTVSYGFHCPGLSSPYVVAQVAIAEDPRVRLTTNAVECDPDELWLGRGMEVVFAGIEDVWLPLFRPAVDSIEYPAPLPEDDAAVAITPHVRVPFREDKFEDRVVISGIGMSPIGRRLMVSPLSLTIQASHAAIADAGLDLADIDGVASYPGFGDVGGYGEGIDRLDWDQGTMTHVPQVLGQAAHMWSRTSLRPDDVDVAELYDGFTFNCLSWMEALGFCGIGEAAEFLDGGRAIARDGVLPVNTHGGQLSHGRTHGMGLVHEAVSQLRGQAGARQIAGARVGVVSSGGLTPSGVLLLRGDG
ncbi:MULTISPECIES: thiolase C-terminal domain-containing protein [Nocardia]|uniref:thiolase C-terminal domain-containing protein n=1 Tax=Nocardia TaxID=1817 RepID=UPI001E2CB090|nr:MULTISPECIES: OB-fold domain-containing protein [Nocardia]